MNDRQLNRPLILNLDKSFRDLKETEAFYLLNHERGLNIHGDKKTGSNIGKSTGLIANYPACDLEQPGGENYTVGNYKSPLTNEAYSLNFNSNGVHFLKRISDAKGCEIVYSGCLDLSAEPEHYIAPWRAYLKIDKTCKNAHGKYFVWVDGRSDIGMIDVEASIATDYFTTPFFKRCADPCALIKMCVPDPCECLRGEFIPLQPNEISLTNHMIDTGFKFIYRWRYYDGRTSIWSDPSTLYFQDVSDCFDTSEGRPRCIRLRIPIGNPLVSEIEIGYSKGQLSEAGEEVWYLSDTIEKYKKYNSNQQFWYERELAELENYSDNDCSFDYKFCNDKLCQSIDINEVNRVYNPIPREPQGLIPLKNVLGFYNYKKGNCPIEKREIEKFDVSTDCNAASCETEFSTVKFRTIIHNTTHNRNQFIYRLNGENNNALTDDISDPAWFGGLNPKLDGGFEVGYSQTFKDKTRNFIGYVEGEDYWSEMKQWKAHALFTVHEEWGTVGRMDKVATRNRWRRAINNGEFFYQECIIKVPKGTKGFLRIASHEVVDGSLSNQDTSTFVIGLLNDIRSYNGHQDITPLLDMTKEEMYFDTCNGDVELFPCFVIQDNAVDSGLSKKASAYNGYIKDANGLPVEGALVGMTLFSNFEIFSITDHNGFYHFYINPGTNNSVNVLINVEKDCNPFSTIQTMQIQGAAGEDTKHDEAITSDLYKTDFFANVKMKVEDCDGNGIGGVRVALSGSKYRVTDGFGFANFTIRNYHTRDRSLRAIVLNSKGCFGVDCNNNCNPCMPTSVGGTPPCYIGKPTITLAKAKINKGSLLDSSRGLKGGGRYGFAFVVRWNCGRISAANEIKYLDIPKTQEKNKLNFCSLKYNGNGITLPSDAICLDILRTENLNPFELQWVIDKLERTSDGNIKLTIQSLNDYNANHNFKTNTIYQWLKGDRIEFVRNGDGKIFSSLQNGLLNYLTLSPFHDVTISGQKDAPADYFNQLLIKDDGKLGDLKEGALIEIQRSKECSTQPVYYSICTSIPLVNGKLLYDSGTFHSFDTYIVNRKIGSFPSQPFEHHSPSDFWGTRLSDIGRPYFVNKFEDEKRFGRNITLNAISEYNFFGSIEKTFDCPEQGDITSMGIIDGKIIAALGENDNFLAEAGNDLLQVGSDGIVRALPADRIISDPKAKISGQYGCPYSAIGGIYYGDGWFSFIDSTRRKHIIHDYQTAKPADDGKMQTYFIKRCQEIEFVNKSTTNPLDKLRFITGYNCQSNALMITIKALRQSGINNEKAAFEKPNETIMFHPYSGDYLTFASFTPEAYGEVNLRDENGCAFVSYLHGNPYIHPIIPIKWNEFYGIAVDRVVGISLNKYPEKIKRGLAIEIDDQTMWYVSDVTTEMARFKSEIPAIKWEKSEDKWNAKFLCNKNGRGGLYGNQKNYAGEETRGHYINVVFVRDNTDALKYGTIDNNKRVAYDELSEILFKFMASEQSGFTENL